MALPVFVGAGAGVERLTAGSLTASKTGCTAGNLLVLHMSVGGVTGDWSGWSTAVNISALDGTASSLSALLSGGSFQIYVGRVTSNGTCSANVAVGASGEDIVARVYEFSGEATGTTVATVFENAGGLTDNASGTGTSVGDAITVTNAGDRLAINLVSLDTAQAIAHFTGASGGTWAEAETEYIGTTLTLQLQKADMTSAGTIDGGSVTVGSSTPWLTIGTAIIHESGGGGGGSAGGARMLTTGVG